jgi:alpha,alpha-trehalose phosphorylase
MRDYDDRLLFDPKLPDAWDLLRFKVRCRGRLIGVDIGRKQVSYRLISGKPITLYSGKREIYLSEANSEAVLPVD